MLYAIREHSDWLIHVHAFTFEDHTCQPAEKADLIGVSTCTPNMTRKGANVEIMEHSFLPFFIFSSCSLQSNMVICVMFSSLERLEGGRGFHIYKA